MLHCLDPIDSLGWLANLCFSKSVFLRLTLTFNSAKSLQNNDSESCYDHQVIILMTSNGMIVLLNITPHISPGHLFPVIVRPSSTHRTQIPLFWHTNFLVFGKYFRIFKGCVSSRSRSLEINNFSFVTLLLLLLRFYIFRSDEADDCWMNLTER